MSTALLLSPNHGYYWAKTTAEGLPGCEVWQHCVASAEVAKCLINSRPDLVDILPAGVVTLVGAHDVGKISPGFQIKCSMWNGPDGETDCSTLKKWGAAYDGNHAYMSKISVWNYYKKLKQSKLGRHWSDYVGAHHGFSLDGYRPEKETSLPDSWESECVSLIRFLENQYGSLPEAPKQPEAMKRLICGLMIVADWVASNELCFPVRRGLADYGKLAENSLGLIGLGNIPKVERKRRWEELFTHCPIPHPLQQHVWNLPAERGVYVIEDSMGGGKTEASLALAYHLLESGKATGIYFALPTQTTSNRIFFRVRDFIKNCGLQLDERSIQLAHGNSWLLRDCLYAEEGKEFSIPRRGQFNELVHWFSSSKRSLLAPFGVGTVDQALMGVVSVKHRDVRAFALAGKVVILDEVHSYDMYTGSLLTSLVQQLRDTGATVIILSATLTRARTAELLGVDVGSLSGNGYPLVTKSVGNEVKSTNFISKCTKSIKLRMEELDPIKTAEIAYAHAQKGECVLWICNTVKTAQEAYNVLKNEACEGGPAIGLLHARYPYWRREELEKEWIGALGKESTQRPRGSVLVSTQVVEQSVDIDADFLISELAPVDMLLQRAGRLWRHTRTSRPCKQAEMLVSVPVGVHCACVLDSYKEFVNTLATNAKVYAPFVLWRTWNALRYRENLILPKDIRPLIEEVYSECTDFTCCVAREGWKLLKTESEKLKQLAKLNQAPTAGVAKDEEGVFTRYGEVTTSDVLLLKRKPCKMGADECQYSLISGDNITVSSYQWSFEAAKSISYNLVRVPKWALEECVADSLLEKYGMRGIYPFFVLENGDLEYYTGERSRLSWNPLSGIIIRSVSKCQDDEESEFMY